MLRTFKEVDSDIINLYDNTGKISSYESIPSMKPELYTYMLEIIKEKIKIDPNNLSPNNYNNGTTLDVFNFFKDDDKKIIAKQYNTALKEIIAIYNGEINETNKSITQIAWEKKNTEESLNIEHFNLLLNTTNELLVLLNDRENIYRELFIYELYHLLEPLLQKMNKSKNYDTCILVIKLMFYLDNDCFQKHHNQETVEEIFLNAEQTLFIHFFQKKNNQEIMKLLESLKLIDFLQNKKKEQIDDLLKDPNESSIKKKQKTDKIIELIIKILCFNENEQLKIDLQFYKSQSDNSLYFPTREKLKEFKEYIYNLDLEIKDAEKKLFIQLILTEKETFDEFLKN